MDLRSDRLYWPTRCKQPRFPAASTHRLRVDVLVLGAGITGAFVAHHLAAAGASVAVADSRGPGRGSTPASTALLLYELDTSLVQLTRLVGAGCARASYLAAHSALRDMQRLCTALREDVELVPRRSLQLAVCDDDLADLRDEALARRALGISVDTLDGDQLESDFGIRRPGALLSEDALEVNPLKLTFALLKDASRHGAHFLPRATIDLSAAARSQRPIRVPLEDGGELIAEHVVIATGYETPEHFSEIAALTQLRSTYVIATEPVTADLWPERALIWETGDPYFYLRTTADDRILMGGEDEAFTTPARREALIDSKCQSLIKKFRELMPNVSVRPALRWAGTFAQTADGLPYIGRHPRWPGVHFALGYGGNGITFSLIAAQIICGDITGSPHPAARLFTFDR